MVIMIVYFTIGFTSGFYLIKTYLPKKKEIM